MFEIEDIGTLIESAGLGTLGSDILLYHSNPDSPTPCIILYPSNDPPPISPETPYYMKGKFQTIVRANRYQDGIDLSKQLITALTLHNEETTQMTIKEVRPLFQTRVFRRSDSGHIEFSTTFTITYVQKTS